MTFSETKLFLGNETLNCSWVPGWWWGHGPLWPNRLWPLTFAPQFLKATTPREPRREKGQHFKHHPNPWKTTETRNGGGRRTQKRGIPTLRGSTLRGSTLWATFVSDERIQNSVFGPRETPILGSKIVVFQENFNLNSDISTFLAKSEHEKKSNNWK